MAELDETRDPKELVPGDVDALRTTAGSLNEFGEVLARAGNGLKEIDDGGWTGEAADAFHTAFEGEPARWITCGDCFHLAKDAVNRYADTLSWAQDEAAGAIDLWEQAEQATSQAQTQHQQDQQQAEEQATAAGSPAPSPVPFSDPGEDLREQARQKLDRARDEVVAAGDTAAGVVDQAQQPAPEEPGFLESAVDGITDAIGDGVRAAGEAVADGLRAVGDGVDDVLDFAGDVVDGALDFAGDVVDGALDVGGDVVDGVLGFVGGLTGIDAVSDAGDAVDGALDDAGDAVDGAMDDAGDWVNRVTDEAGDTVSDGADDAGDAVEDTADDGGDEVDPDEDDDGTDEDDDGTGEDGDNDQDGEHPDNDDPDGDDGGDGDNQEVDRNGHWEDANGEKPDPDDISASDARAHILYGDANGTDGGHRHDSGVPNKTTFPESWDDDKIIDEVEDVAKNPDNPPVYDEDTGRWEVEGTRDGVDIFVVVEPDGTIVTGHPTGGEGVHRNDEDGNPQPLE